MKFKLPLWLRWNKRPQDDPKRFDKATRTFILDPKAGAMIACGVDYEGIKLPNDLSGDALDTVIEYLTACMKLGFVLSFANSAYGARVSKTVLAEFETSERKYANLGYQPLEPKTFTGLAGWNKPLPADDPVLRKVDNPKTYVELIRKAYQPYINA